MVQLLAVVTVLVMVVVAIAKLPYLAVQAELYGLRFHTQDLGHGDGSDDVAPDHGNARRVRQERHVRGAAT